jgi:hypothetical protein
VKKVSYFTAFNSLHHHPPLQISKGDLELGIPNGLVVSTEDWGSGGPRFNSRHHQKIFSIWTIDKMKQKRDD